MDSRQSLHKPDFEVAGREVHVAQQPKRPLSKRILAVIWDSWDKSPEERAFVAKIDFWILTYVCIAYFVKYLDQTNISNAYVSGMKEDLVLTGNDLNYLTTYWTIGYILGQIPSQLIMLKIRPSIWLPTLELAWGFLVMGMAAAKNVKTLFVLRFFIGLLEASAYPGIMTLLGNWYTPAELGKRSCIFQASSAAAQMFSGYLQAGLLKMDGRYGVAAWQWLFIFDGIRERGFDHLTMNEGIIGVPIAIYGYFAIPDQPTSSKARWLKPDEKKMGIARMEAVGRQPVKNLTLKKLLSILKSWQLHMFCAIFTAHVLGIRIYSYFNVWLKSTKRWSTAEVNLIPTAGYGAQLLSTLAYAWISDAIGKRWPVIVGACVPAIIGCIILSVWPASNIPAMMAGWILTFLETGAGALIITWIQEICSASAEHRIVIIGIVEAIAFTFQAWVPLFIYNTGKAPRFPIGYQMAAMFFALEAVLVLVARVLNKRFPLKGKEIDELE
ncbi:pantothenate transporter liz1 [Pleomassaria siparia CBS 279.74]|uniref:Pantothenate transporter liz1 n=1 Tax=Pleomassaria siparia CBS 279.74 TaxID=1314801 RepID=A0A6G1KH62_9PLEO|nr:pantothenate transporter liz1 [Pleomassaria siparia CBS 279.74]